MSYLYRDASNYKRMGEVIVEGHLSFAQLERFLDQQEEYFCPWDVGLEHPGEAMTSWPSSDDHPWCKLRKDNFEPAPCTACGLSKKEHARGKCLFEPTSFTPAKAAMTARELIERFRKAYEAGWPEAQHWNPGELRKINSSANVAEYEEEE